MVQKKRRKRTLDGVFELDGNIFCWRLLSEPLWSTEHGYKGLCISVLVKDAGLRELILEYPFPTSEFGSVLPLPQRPAVSAKIVEADVRQAMAAGWDPMSRGKTFLYRVTGNVTAETTPWGWRLSKP